MLINPFYKENKEMRILFVLHSLANFAGIERVMSDKINYMARQGHDVLLVTYEQGEHALSYPLDDSVKHQNIEFPFFRVYQYGYPKRLYKIWRMKHGFKQEFQKIVTTWKPDVIVVPSNAGDYMAEIMSIANTKKIVEAHCSLPAFLKGDSLKDKVIKRLLFRYITKCDLLVALTYDDQCCWQRHIRCVTAVPNPVAFYLDNPDYSLRQIGRILAIGRFHVQKRFDRLVEAFALIAEKHPNWYIDIFGKGEFGEEEKLQQLIDYAGMKNRIILHAPTRDVIPEYLQSQFFVLSSDYEGFGLVLIEAMACGIPVVSTNCPYGPSEIISDGETGLLAGMDAKDLAEKMEWMITHEKERKEMGIKAHKAAARYKRDVVMKEWENTYVSLQKNVK